MEEEEAKKAGEGSLVALKGKIIAIFLLDDLEEMKNGAIAHPKLQKGQKRSRRQIRQNVGKLG